MKRSLVAAALAAAFATSATAQPVAPAAKTSIPPRAGSQCFRSQDYQSFRPVDEHAFNIRVNVNDYYRIEVEGTCPALVFGDAYLITQVRGSDLICGPLDWDLKIGQNGAGGFATPCIVKSQTRLTPAEVAAIPPRQKP